MQRTDKEININSGGRQFNKEDKFITQAYKDQIEIQNKVTKKIDDEDNLRS